MTLFKRSLLFLFAISFMLACTKDSADDIGGQGLDRTANLKSLGSSASDLLSDATYTSINIEIVYVEGNRPTDEGINKFREYLEDRIF